MDVDKWDYFARDGHCLGISNNFDMRYKAYMVHFNLCRWHYKGAVNYIKKLHFCSTHEIWDSLVSPACDTYRPWKDILCLFRELYFRRLSLIHQLCMASFLNSTANLKLFK